MRDRIRTPFFFIPWGEKSTQEGVESPAQTIEGRALVGRVVGDRFLLREKTGHSTESVHYSAHDMLGDIDVSLEVYPDGTAATGYRLGIPDATDYKDPLPNLYKAELDSTEEAPGEPEPSMWHRLWAVLSRRR